MKKLNLGGHIVEIYDDIEELPIVNFQKYNKFALMDSGIGSSTDDIDSHILRIAKLIELDKDKAVQELQNMHTSLYMAVSEISPANMAFAALIHSVDGEVVTDLSDDNLKSVMDKLKSGKQSVVDEASESVKKNLTMNLKRITHAFFRILGKEKQKNF